MNNHTTFIVMLLIINIAMAVYGYQRIREILAKTEDVKNYLQRSKKWPKIDVKIISLGLNLDYPWPQGSKLRENEEEISSLRLIYADDLIHQGVKIEYEYFIDGHRYTSRNLQLVPIRKREDLFYHLSLGDNVKARVNPENHSEIFLKKNDPEDIQEYTMFLLRDLRPLAFVQVGTAFLLAMLIFYA